MTVETGKKAVAVLSTTVLPQDGVYGVVTLAKASVFPNFDGVPHYIGHPDTAKLVEEFGAVKAESKLFSGLKVGEVAICVPIQQGKSTRATEGFTSPHQNLTLGDLDIRILQRFE